MSKGAVACGHPATAAAAREILEDGGNAFDAALAAMCAAAVAEPVLCSFGGGGFLLANPSEGDARLYDFFVQTPHNKRPLSETDFYPVHADFGTATQEFHIGLGAVATPGAIRGLFAVHRDLASLPLRRLIEPAVCLAREGVSLRKVDGYLFRVVGPILMARGDSRGLYSDPQGDLLNEGGRFRPLELASFLEALAIEGEALFYDGDVGRALIAACRDQGGLLVQEDLLAYRVEVREPLHRRYRDARISTNPLPSTGGMLIAFALELLSHFDLAALPPGSADHLSLLARAMAQTNHARIVSRLDHGGVDAAGQAAASRLLAPELLEAYLRELKNRPLASRGTTHVSIIDDLGNQAALTLSNGEGCGFVLPGTGIMMNNMLGEEDLNPDGFEAWPTAVRLASMMSPTVATLDDGTQLALGSGGSNRIRTAILQVLIGLIDHRVSLAEAVEAPRLHYERGVVNLEGDLGAGQEDCLVSIADQSKRWPLHNLFFGGVHSVARFPSGHLEAAADPRRGGAAFVF